MVRDAKVGLTAAIAASALAISLTLVPPTAEAAGAQGVLPVPALDAAPNQSGLQTATFAGGCFWGVQAVFEHVGGVTKAVSGYAGGSVADPTYKQVSAGTTGHAESVQVTFDPSRVSYARLLQIFFTVALDPTQVDRQGPDVGTQYRSELFVSDPVQAQIANSYIQQLDAAHLFNGPIATRVSTAGPFFSAEPYHQDYLERHPTEPYIMANDMPKVHKLQTLFPAVWQSTPVRAGEVASTN
jgi:peptide-methionine (S)-S-oxide reductase